MSRIGRLVGALALLVSLWAPEAEAQSRRSTPAPETPTIQALHPDPFDLRFSRHEFSSFSGPDKTGLTATVPLGPNVHFAVGRFSVPNFRPPRMEAAEIRRGNRNIAAFGLSLRF
jgi:hypothetical protein